MLAACTGATPSPRSAPPSSVASPSPSGGAAVRSITLDVVAPTGRGDLATTAGRASLAARQYLDGITVGVRDVNDGGGVNGVPLRLAMHDGGGPATATRLIAGALDARATAILYVGPGTALPPLRYAFAKAGTPVVLLQGDVYTSGQTFPQVFQTTLPWVWQARVIARYVVLDRRAKDVVFGGAGPEAPAAARAMRDALAYWGGHLASSFTYSPGSFVPAADVRRAAAADWFVAFGDSVDARTLVDTVETAAHLDRDARPSERPGVTGPASLLATIPGVPAPQAGTSACYTYPWAGWAHPIPRVAAFEDEATSVLGHSTSGLEQEGYDAVRLLAASLRRDGGLGGASLTSALEDVRDSVYSSFEIVLGPDDHELLPRDELGLFAVAGRDERVDPWQRAGSEPWRAVMRTFTYQGTRTVVLDRDKTIFFPSWRANEPQPDYSTSRYGITTPPSDPLH